jgi:hypothetical protein
MFLYCCIKKKQELCCTFRSVMNYICYQQNTVWKFSNIRNNAVNHKESFVLGKHCWKIFYINMFCSPEQWFSICHSELLDSNGKKSFVMLRGCWQCLTERIFVPYKDLERTLHLRCWWRRREDVDDNWMLRHGKSNTTSPHNVVNTETSGDEMYQTFYLSAPVTSLSVQENTPNSRHMRTGELSEWKREQRIAGRKEGKAEIRAILSLRNSGRLRKSFEKLEDSWNAEIMEVQ